MEATGNLAKKAENQRVNKNKGEVVDYQLSFKLLFFPAMLFAQALPHSLPLPSIQRLNKHIDEKVASDQIGSWADKITVISGHGLIRAKDGSVISKPTQQPNLFWALQIPLIEKLTSVAQNSRGAAIKELTNAILARYLKDPMPLISFIRDLDSEQQWIMEHQVEQEHRKQAATLETLITITHNLLLWQLP